MTVIISNRASAIYVTSFGQLINLLEYGRAVEIRSDLEQLAAWPAEKIEHKIYEITGQEIQVYKM